MKTSPKTRVTWQAPRPSIQAACRVAPLQDTRAATHRNPPTRSHPSPRSMGTRSRIVKPFLPTFSPCARGGAEQEAAALACGRPVYAGRAPGFCAHHLPNHRRTQVGQSQPHRLAASTHIFAGRCARGPCGPFDPAAATHRAGATVPGARPSRSSIRVHLCSSVVKQQ